MSVMSIDAVIGCVSSIEIDCAVLGAERQCVRRCDATETNQRRHGNDESTQDVRGVADGAARACIPGQRQEHGRH